MSRLAKKSKPQKFFINGKPYQIVERAGTYRIALNGFLGWTSVWADSMETLYVRLRLVLGVGQ